MPRLYLHKSYNFEVRIEQTYFSLKKLYQTKLPKEEKIKGLSHFLNWELYTTKGEEY